MGFIKKILDSLKNILRKKNKNLPDENGPLVLEGSELINKEPPPPPKVQAAPLRKKRLSTLGYFLIIAACCAILLSGIVAGIIISERRTKTRFAPQPPIIAETREKNIIPRFSPLDPVSGDWGISPFALSERMNETLDAVGARSSIIKKILTPSGREFRYSFSASLMMLGEIAANGNVTRTALFFDPVFSHAEYQNALAVIRAIISAIDPSLTREAILEAEAKLGLSQDIEPPAERNSEIRLGKFVLRLWSVAGSAFVFTASSM